MAYTSVRNPSNPVAYALPTCASWPASTPLDFTATSIGGTSTPPDRWTMLVKTLTGAINGAACSAEARNTTDFNQEFGLGGTSYANGAAAPPADSGYYLPYNRIIATGVDPSTGATVTCTPAPSWDPTIRQALLTHALDWPTNASAGAWPATTDPIVWRTTGPFATSKICPFDAQEPDGIIDAYRELVRFGFMTFDSSPNWTHNGVVTVGTGLETDGVQAYYPSGIGDTWSYFPGWNTGSSTSAATGWPGGCDSAAGLGSGLLEVGVRNPAAPPWEGRMLGFGNMLADTNTIAANNARVQAAISAIRPFGGTPVAGMLEDARYFLLQDSSVLPSSTDPNPYFWGGATDTSVSTDPNSDACRKRYIILLTDGGPNLDLRPECSLSIQNTSGTNTAGKCPYPLPTDTATTLKNHNIPVYVIGFAVSNSGSGSTRTCTELQTVGGPYYRSCTTLASCTTSTCGTGTCAYGYCINSPDDELLATCCSIEGIADAGGGKAYFAEDASGLFTSFAQILKDVVQPPIAPAQPVFSAASSQYNNSNNTQPFQGAEFLSASHQATSGTNTILGDLGIGDLDRQRIVCGRKTQNGPLEAIDQPVSQAEGDKFQVNLDDNRNQRTIFTVIGQTVQVGSVTHIWSDRTIRPLYHESVGDQLGSYGISKGDTTTNLVKATSANFPGFGDVDPRAVVDANDCSNGKCCFALTSTQADCAKYYLTLELALTSGLPTQVTFRRSSAFGAVERTPLLVPPPSAYMRDDSYTTFQRVFASATNGRPPVLYATTADGQLHAFSITTTGSTNLNEMWSFIPPAMLPAITRQFQNRLTASALHLMDGVLVSRDVAGSATVPQNGRFLSRTAAQAKGDPNNPTHWYTILLGSYGTKPGFFALDVTWPDPTKAPPIAGYAQGPRFLWQLTTDADGNPLFGDRGSRPSIATLFFQMPGDQAAAEHAVAILPGGWGGQASPNTFVPALYSKSGSSAVLDSRFTPRTTTREYTPDAAPDSPLKLPGARSVTIVRLDTGEIVRTFRYGDPTVPAKATDKQAPDALYTTNPLRIANAGFDAPMVGEVVTYPALPGVVADRAYLGDAEGRLWRLNLASTDPTMWNASMVLDAYPTGGTYATAKYAETEATPIETPPVISTDPLGRVTVAVSTGDQQTLTTAGKYPVWSYTEWLTSGTPVTHVNWFLNEQNSVQKEGASDLHFGGGERVMGPMSLFSGVLYFSSQRPPATGLTMCSNGEAFLWAVHYLNAGLKPGIPNSADGPDKGPMPEHPPDFVTDPNVVPNPLSPDLVRYLSLGADSVAYGVGIRQRPSCYETAETSDPFLGFGSHSSITTATPGNFQLVVQSGGAGSTSGASNIKTITETISPPAGGVTVDSWAAILE